MPRVDIETLDKDTRVGVDIRIEEPMRMSVSAQKVLQSEHVALMCMPDDHRPTGILFDQADAAQDERAHDPLAELGLGNQQRSQSRPASEPASGNREGGNERHFPKRAPRSGGFRRRFRAR